MFDDVRCGLRVGELPRFKVGDYVNLGALAEPTWFSPSFNGYWGMLANNSVSNCVQTGCMHLTKEYAYRGKRALVPFKPENAIQAYSESTGYNGMWLTDQGTDILAFSEFWRTAGLPDANGLRHKIDAYAELPDPTDIAAVRKLIREFGGIGLGYNLASDAERQYRDGRPWMISGAGDGETHFVSAVGWNSTGNLLVVTWPDKPGQLQAVTPSYHRARCVIAIVYFSFELLDAKGFSADQLDAARLRADISALKSKGAKP